MFLGHAPSWTLSGICDINFLSSSINPLVDYVNYCSHLQHHSAGSYSKRMKSGNFDTSGLMSGQGREVDRGPRRFEISGNMRAQLH